VCVGSKHAVEGVTKSAAIELAGTGVRVNIVGPGPVETRMFNHFAQTEDKKANFLDSQIPNKRIGTPEEIANAIMFIGSDKGSYIIGHRRRDDRGLGPPELGHIAALGNEVSCSVWNEAAKGAIRERSEGQQPHFSE
jgi:enoyl-[acyl-carrier-protein] reductase (NADH)